MARQAVDVMYFSLSISGREFGPASLNKGSGTLEDLLIYFIILDCYLSKSDKETHEVVI